jgi:rhodanese-related sulfurtransferase
MVACNDLDGHAPAISPAEFLHRLDVRDDLVLDVRMPSECANGYIPGALNIPLDELRARLGEIPRDRHHIYVHCAAGFRAHLAVRILLQHGFDQVSNISGGWMSIRHFFPLPAQRIHR